MKIKFCIVSSFVILLALANLGFQDFEQIPKVWDLERISSMHLPFPDSSVAIQPVSEEYYYKLPQRVAYKSYPFYMPGREPKGYFEQLRQLPPEIIFDAAGIKTESDWLRAGEIIYDMPEVYEPIDSAYLAALPELAKHWTKFIPTTPDGIIPFLSIVVREKGRIELGSRTCGMCHTKLMPDGSLLKGGQGNFQFTRYLVSLLRVQRDFQKVPDSVIKVRSKAFNRLLFEAPWIHHESQDRLKKLTIEEWLNSFGTPQGVFHRPGTGLGYPVSAPDLFNLKERKYFDRTGHLMQRDIGDLMRYATFNQSADKLDDLHGFTSFNRSADPQKGNVTRFSDEQLYALAKYLYSLKTPKNPVLYPERLLKRGEAIFKEEGCIDCHRPPLYSNNKLTPADGFEPPADHFDKYDITNIAVGTDPSLTLYTRRGSGYYKIPSLIGAWNRTAFLHGGYLANLEDMFDSTRFSPDYVPTGYSPPWSAHMAIKGHRFGTGLDKKDKAALIAFVKSL
ncbi:MAG: hypothetical protein ABJC98_23405 [Bacteroidota bacterium]